jgi:peroxiredoxin
MGLHLANRNAMVAILVSATMLLSMCIGEPELVGNDAPKFTLLDVDDRPHNLTDYRGRVLVIDFFATWCVPCLDQIQVLKDLRPQLNESDVAFLMIDTDDRESKEKVTKYRDDLEITWPMAIKGQEVSLDYEITVIPTTILVDRKGVVRYYHEGVSAQSTLLERIQELL